MVLIFVLIVTIIDFTEKNDFYIKHQLSKAEILAYYIDFVPFIVNLLTPITVFIATVFVSSRLAMHTEIIAMLGSGMSFRRIMVPYLIGATIIAGMNFYLNGWVIPKSNKDRVAFEVKYLRNPFHYDGRNIHIKIAPDLYLYMESYNNRSNVGYKFGLDKIVDGELKEKMTALSLRWNEETQKWKILNWTLRKFDGQKEIVTQGEKMDTTLAILPKDFESDFSLQETFTLNELYQYIEELEHRGSDNIRTYEVEKYIRFMSPFTVLVLVFIGLTVSSKKTRGGTGFQIALGFVIAFIFIIFFIMSKSVAESGNMLPWIAVWIPNIIFTGVGLFLYRFVPR